MSNQYYLVYGEVGTGKTRLVTEVCCLWGDGICKIRLLRRGVLRCASIQLITKVSRNFEAAKMRFKSHDYFYSCSLETSRDLVVRLLIGIGQDRYTVMEDLDKESPWRNDIYWSVILIDPRHALNTHNDSIRLIFTACVWAIMNWWYKNAFLISRPACEPLWINDIKTPFLFHGLRVSHYELMI